MIGIRENIFTFLYWQIRELPESGKKKAAKQLIISGMKYDYIAECTGLPLEVIQKIHHIVKEQEKGGILRPIRYL